MSNSQDHKLREPKVPVVKPFESSKRAIPIAATIALVALVLVAVFTRIMNYALRRDEQMFAPPALLLENHALYTDFFYNHVPGSAWLFHFFMGALETDHLVFAARLAVFGAWLLFAGGVAWITYILTRSLNFTIFCVLLVLTNDAWLTTAGMAASNNFLPLPLGYLGLGLFIIGVSGDRVNSLAVGVSGLLLGISAGIKASAVGFIPGVAIAAFLLPARMTFSSRLLRIALPLAAGGIIGALPVLLYLAADPEFFLAHVLNWHTGPHAAYWADQARDGGEVAISLAAKAQLAYLIWTGGANIILIFCIVLLVIVAAEGGTLSELRLKLMTGPVILVSATTITAVGVSFIPTPGFPQYFAPPLACALLLPTLLYAELDSTRRRQIRPVLIAACVVLVIVNLPRLTQHLGRLAAPDSWTVMRVHQHGLSIAARLADAGVEGKVATIAPVYPLEGGLPVYPELATGQFAYRSAEFTEVELARHYRTTSPATIEDLFNADPPAAILVGFEPALEAPMVRFAEDNGYVRIDDLKLVDRYGTGVLYIRPIRDAGYAGIGER